MDSLRGFDDDAALPAAAEDEPAIERPPEIGVDERRMHVRAYNYWVSLLGGRAYPSIQDIDPSTIEDFGPHSVLLDFSRDHADPEIAFLGRALRIECGLDAAIRHISEVPSRSLLSRLTDHYLQIIANCAPIGFEAEFVGQRGYNTLYRGILMPLSSDGESIDFIYGVINWKELADSETEVAIAAEASAIAPAPAASIPRRRQPGLGGRPQCRFRRSFGPGTGGDSLDDQTLSLWPNDAGARRPALRRARQRDRGAATAASAAAPRSIARSARPMISPSPPTTRPRIMPSCSPRRASRPRRARR